jgi:Na+-driven multidrug efflux pump
MMLLQSVFQAVNVGTTALIARFVGMGRHEKASETLKRPSTSRFSWAW